MATDRWIKTTAAGPDSCFRGDAVKMINQDFDAIVVGSGITGGWAAKELTEKGLKVLVLERGRDVRHSVDYLGEHAPDWKLSLIHI